jgi:hypothetical protein
MRAIKLKDRMTDRVLHDATVSSPAAAYYMVLHHVDRIVDPMIFGICRSVSLGVYNDDVN